MLIERYVLKENIYINVLSDININIQNNYDDSSTTRLVKHNIPVYYTTYINKYGIRYNYIQDIQYNDTFETISDIEKKNTLPITSAIMIEKIYFNITDKKIIRKIKMKNILF